MDWYIAAQRDLLACEALDEKVYLLGHPTIGWFVPPVPHDHLESGGGGGISEPNWTLVCTKLRSLGTLPPTGIPEPLCRCTEAEQFQIATATLGHLRCANRCAKDPA